MVNDEDDSTIPVFRGIGGPEIGRAYVYEKNGETVASIYLDADIVPNTISALSIYSNPERNDP